MGKLTKMVGNMHTTLNLHFCMQKIKVVMFEEEFIKDIFSINELIKIFNMIRNYYST